MIMNAPCDVLTILDCCEGGGAAVPLPNNNPNIPLYGKELIAASSWSTKSYGRMSEALCRVLPTLNKAGKSVQDFVALLDTELKSMLKSRWEELDKKLMELDEEQKNLQRKTKRLAELCREVEKLELYKMRREAKKKLEKEKGNERRRPMPQGKSTSGVNQQLLGLREEIDELNKEKLPNEADLILRKSKLEEKVGQLKQKHGQPVHRRLQTSVRTRAPSQTRSPNKIIIKNFNAPNAPSAPS
ncbi:hypothetical protein F4804DRAFT_287986 [Jackrogersella minutella]|nr:hypothetical protein F4804DRAFT_287986 [Jackrogersella minutella]